MSAGSGMSDVVIVGGGIVGACCAFYLAREGIDATLIERAGIASQASAWNPGGVNPLHGEEIPGRMAPFAMHSYRLHHDIVDELQATGDTSVSLRSAPRVQLALNEQEQDRLSRVEARYNATEGFSAEYMPATALRAMLPALRPRVVGGLLQRGNCSVDTREYAGAMINYAKARGLRVISGELTEIIQGDHGAIGIRVGSDTLRFDKLVLATGSRIAHLSTHLNSALLVQPITGQLLRVRAQQLELNVDITHDLAGVYRQLDGTLMLGGTEEHQGSDPSPDANGRATILHRIAQFIDLGAFSILDHGAGARPVSHDRLPLLGQVPGWDNVYMANGGGRKGVLYASGMGYAVAQMITTGQSGSEAQHLNVDRLICNGR
ncbi:MAG: FAD-binding oxidoreductase [Pseudomonadota bacterium]